MLISMFDLSLVSRYMFFVFVFLFCFCACMPSRAVPLRLSEGRALAFYFPIQARRLSSVLTVVKWRACKCVTYVLIAFLSFPSLYCKMVLLSILLRCNLQVPQSLCFISVPVP